MGRGEPGGDALILNLKLRVERQIAELDRGVRRTPFRTPA
jgi:hypothetical protein